MKLALLSHFVVIICNLKLISGFPFGCGEEPCPHPQIPPRPPSNPTFSHNFRPLLRLIPPSRNKSTLGNIDGSNDPTAIKNSENVPYEPLIPPENPGQYKLNISAESVHEIDKTEIESGSGTLNAVFTEDGNFDKPQIKNAEYVPYEPLTLPTSAPIQQYRQRVKRESNKLISPSADEPVEVTTETENIRTTENIIRSDEYDDENFECNTTPNSYPSDISSDAISVKIEGNVLHEPSPVPFLPPGGPNESGNKHEESDNTESNEMIKSPPKKIGPTTPAVFIDQFRIKPISPSASTGDISKTEEPHIELVDETGSDDGSLTRVPL